MRQSTFKVEFIGVEQIRMASEFNMCDAVRVLSPYQSTITGDFQDLYASDDENGILYLVRWDVDDNNDPGFHIVRVTATGKGIRLWESERFKGVCESIAVEDGILISKSFRYEGATLLNDTKYVRDFNTALVLND